MIAPFDGGEQELPQHADDRRWEHHRQHQDDEDDDPHPVPSDDLVEGEGKDGGEGHLQAGAEHQILGKVLHAVPEPLRGEDGVEVLPADEAPVAPEEAHHVGVLERVVEHPHGGIDDDPEQDEHRRADEGDRHPAMNDQVRPGSALLRGEPVRQGARRRFRRGAAGHCRHCRRRGRARVSGPHGACSTSRPVDGEKRRHGRPKPRPAHDEPRRPGDCRPVSAAQGDGQRRDCLPPPPTVDERRRAGYSPMPASRAFDLPAPDGVRGRPGPQWRALRKSAFHSSD